MGDCPEMYMVFAPRFETSSRTSRTGAPHGGCGPPPIRVDCGRFLEVRRPVLSSALQLWRSHPTPLRRLVTQITVARGFESIGARRVRRGARLKKLSPVLGFAAMWMGLHDLQFAGPVTQPEGGRRVGPDQEADARCKYTAL